MCKLISLTIVSVLLGIVCAVDYCQLKCDDDEEHIGCISDGSWADSCPDDKNLVHISTADKQAIVDAHNAHRNHVAGGGVDYLEPACRMATMQWDDELAYLASLNVKTCKFEHDECRVTEKFEWAGQNIAWVTFYEPLNKTAYFHKTVDMWYSEVEDTEQSHIDIYPPDYDGPTIGHFTVMVADRNTHVGCAVSTYTEPGKPYKAFLMACNYAATNVEGVKIYESCDGSAEKCTTGVNSNYENLCSLDEEYDVNDMSY